MRVKAWADKILYFILGLVTAGGLTLIPSLYGGTSAQEKKDYAESQREKAGNRTEKNEPCVEYSEKQRSGRDN